jgi:hypothetical protein
LTKEEIRMSRGAQKQTQQMADRLFQQQLQMLQNEQSVGQGLAQTLVPKYTQLASYGDPQLENAIQQQAMLPVRTVFDAVREQAQSRAARTNNAAGYAAEQQNLAGQMASGLSNAAQNAKLAYRSDQVQRQMAGLQGLASVYGIDTNLLRSLVGSLPQTLDSRARVSNTPGTLDYLMGAGRNALNVLPFLVIV